MAKKKYIKSVVALYWLKIIVKMTNVCENKLNFVNVIISEAVISLTHESRL